MALGAAVIGLIPFIPNFNYANSCTCPISCINIERYYYFINLCDFTKSSTIWKIIKLRVRFRYIRFSTHVIWHSFLLSRNYLYCFWYRGIILTAVSISNWFILFAAVPYDGSILGDFDTWFLLRMEPWCAFMKIGISLIQC